MYLVISTASQSTSSNLSELWLYLCSFYIEYWVMVWRLRQFF